MADLSQSERALSEREAESISGPKQLQGLAGTIVPDAATVAKYTDEAPDVIDVIGIKTGIDMNLLVPVVAHAVGVFGDETKASHWLQAPLPILENRSPAEIMQNGDYSRVDQILTRIEHNIPS